MEVEKKDVASLVKLSDDLLNFTASVVQGEVGRLSNTVSLWVRKAPGCHSGRAGATRPASISLGPFLAVRF